MVAYLEKTNGNAEFHEIINFLTRSSIHNALTVSPVVSTTFVEQFWMSAKSKIINNVRYITAKVAGKPVSISKNTIRSDLLFGDADGIDSLSNQAIFDAIQLMGYEGDLIVLTFNKALFSPQWRFLFHTMNNVLSSKRPLGNQFPTNDCTFWLLMNGNPTIRKPEFPVKCFDKVPLLPLSSSSHSSLSPSPFSIHLFLFLPPVLLIILFVQSSPTSGSCLLLYESLWVTITLTPSPPHLSEVHVEPQSDPSPRPSPTTHIPDSIPEDSGRNHGGQSSSDRSLSGNEGDMTLQSVYDLCISLCTQVTDQAKEIKHLKAQIKKLKKKAKPIIAHHKAWVKSVSLKQRLAGKKSLKKQWMQKESVSKQGRKPAKAEPSVHKDPLFDELADDTSKVSTDRSRVSTNKEEVSRDMQKVSTDKGRSQRWFPLPEQRAVAIRNRPPTRTQLKSQMMTYLKHVGNKKHSDLKNKTFEEYEAFMRSNKRTVKKEKNDTVKVSAKEKELDHNQNVDMMMYTKDLSKIISFEEGDYLVIYRANGNFRAFNYLLEGDLKINDGILNRRNMIKVDFWNNKQNWEMGSNLFQRFRLQRMLDLGLEVEEESIAALHLVKFIKQQLNEE
ncbi:hypothetical protein Tco_0344336 [Tanacetum coccineum]